MQSRGFLLASGVLFSQAKTVIHRKYFKYSVEISATGKSDFSGSGLMPFNCIQIMCWPISYCTVKNKQTKKHTIKKKNQPCYKQVAGTTLVQIEDKRQRQKQLRGSSFFDYLTIFFPSK